MEKTSIFVFLATTVCLSAIFGVYHYTTVTRTIEETSTLIGVSEKTKDNIERVTLPQEFVDFVKQGDASAKGNLTNEMFALKKLAFTNCLYQISSTTNFWRKEVSDDEFIKAGKASVEGISVIEESARLYASKYFSEKRSGSGLLVATCLDFYDSRDLKEVLTSLEKAK